MAKVSYEVQIEVEGPATQRSLLGALEAPYPAMRGTIRMLNKDHGHKHASRLYVGDLKWIGRNSDGIGMWRGIWRTIPKWFCNSFKALGIGLVCLSAIFASVGLWEAVPGPLIAGTFHTLVGFFFLERMRYKMSCLITAEQAAEQFGVGVQELRKVVDEEGIRPTYILNDDPIYELNSFGDVGILLRSAERPPENDENLLRAVGGVTNGQPDHLLRPAESETVTPDSVHETPLATTQPQHSILHEEINIIMHAR